MGVIYKLRPEIKDFIVEKKKINPIISCRGLTELIESEFKIKLSKSTINAIIKDAGLSMPIGRRLKKHKHHPKEQIVESKEPPLESPSKELVPVEKKPEQIAQPISIPKIEEPVEEIKPPQEAPETPIILPEEKPIEEKKEELPEVQIEKPEEPVIVEKQEELIPPPEPILAKEELAQPVAPEEVIEKEPEKEEISEPVVEKVVEPAILPVAREEVKKNESYEELVSTGAVLLKAADFIIGGSSIISDAIRSRIMSLDAALLAKTESAIYLPLFQGVAGGQEDDLEKLWSLVGRNVTLDAILTYLDDLQKVKPVNTDIIRIIDTSAQEVRCIKLDLSNGSILYLDGQFQTVWSTPHIPHSFNLTVNNVKGYINNYFFEEKPLILGMAPGYDSPTDEFFNFALSLDSRERKIRSLSLIADNLEEIEVIPVETARRRFFIFGLWPWQFTQSRKVSLSGEFKPYQSNVCKKELFIASLGIILSQVSGDKSLTLRGYAIKTNLNEKTRLVILSNLPIDTSPDLLIEPYLGRWPNFEEAFKDFSRKVELFTYTANSQKYFSSASADLFTVANIDIKTIFNQYLKLLDMFVKYHFLPPGSEDTDFSSMKEQFYSLKTTFKKEKGCVFIKFLTPEGYASQKLLSYACNRLNEREIIFFNGLRAWFSL
ncbi:MAG: hypothetical protein PHO70_01050 [Candidatus Omnitrophica bacterium]|nr:hypothetical protein [Candidatus Omnitrophota bacterium]